MSMTEFHWIKRGDEQIRLFKSLANHRLVNDGETLGEYKVRQLLNRKMLKKYKQVGNVEHNIPVPKSDGATFDLSEGGETV